MDGEGTARNGEGRECHYDGQSVTMDHEDLKTVTRGGFCGFCDQSGHDQPMTSLIRLVLVTA